MPSESDKWGWKHVSVFGGFDKGSGTKRWKCNHCNLRYNGSYSRVRAHLLGFTGVGVKSCSAIDRSLRKAFQILEEERLASKGNKISGSEKSAKRAKTSQLCLSSPIRTLAKEDVDDTVARFLYAEGLNANVVNSHYFQEMAKALADFGPGYEAPSVDSLNDAFLKKEKSRIEKAITLVKESWTHTGCTILCVNRLDGLIGCFCINFFVSSPRGVMFLKEVDMNDDCGSDGGLIIALTDVILEAGPTNVLQVITHLGHFSRGFESVTEARFPHIFWSHCTLHSINLLMEEIAELDWMKAVVSCARGIDQLISTYRRCSSCLVIDTTKECSDPLSLKFAPSYSLVKRIFEMKQALQEEVVGEEWKQWKLTTPEDVSSIEAVIFGDDFWGRAHLMLQLYEPFMRLLATFDIKKSIMGDVCYWWVQSLEAVRSRGIDEVTVNQLELLAENRWDVLFSPLHAAGYILNPRYFGRGQSKKKTLMRGWKATVERYESDSATRLLLREQLSAYWRLQGSLGEADAMECRDKMDPVAWWENFGFETPNLQTLAIKILSQVSCVDVCRESWQCDNLPCQEAIKRSAVERGEDIEDLVFVRNNLRLQSQKL